MKFDVKEKVTDTFMGVTGTVLWFTDGATQIDEHEIKTKDGMKNVRVEVRVRPFAVVMVETPGKALRFLQRHPSDLIRADGVTR